MKNSNQADDCSFQMLRDCNNFLLTDPIWIDQDPKPLQSLILPNTLIKISHFDAKYKINTRLSVDIKIKSKTWVAEKIPPMKKLHIIIKKLNLKSSFKSV